MPKCSRARRAVGSKASRVRPIPPSSKAPAGRGGWSAKGRQEPRPSALGSLRTLRAGTEGRQGSYMRTLIATFAAGAMLAVLAGPAMADTSSAREIQSAVDGYLTGSRTDASLVGGAGSAGYDRGFWIRG